MTEQAPPWPKQGPPMGHGHANALVGWTLAGNVARP